METAARAVRALQVVPTRHTELLDKTLFLTLSLLLEEAMAAAVKVALLVEIKMPEMEVLAEVARGRQGRKELVRADKEMTGPPKRTSPAARAVAREQLEELRVVVLVA